MEYILSKLAEGNKWNESWGTQEKSKPIKKKTTTTGKK